MQQGRSKSMWTSKHTGIMIGLVIAAEATVGAQSAQRPLTASQKARRTPIVEVFERTKDAVVNIAATQIVERKLQFGLFDELFNPRDRTRRYAQTSLGSGAVIHRQGYVITNAHVVAHAAALKVIFANKTEHEAEAVAVDEKHDLAVLKIKGEGPFPALTMGRSSDIMVGETAIAIGNALGYEHTVTSGIVSALHRKLPVAQNVVYDDLIQTDASINRGNSGGPLLNILGELIGLNTAIRSDAQNIGFAIPADSIRKLLPDILSVEQRRRIQIGLRLGWRDKIYVSEVSGPAEEAGVEVGDEVLQVDGIPVHQDLDYYVHVLNVDLKKGLVLELKRGQKHFKATIHPKAIPIPDGAQLLRRKFGLQVQPLTPELAEQLDLKGGLVITGVDADSPAGMAGFRRGLIVVRIGNYFPTDMDGLGMMLEKVKRGDKLKFLVYQVLRYDIQVLEGELSAR